MRPLLSRFVSPALLVLGLLAVTITGHAADNKRPKRLPSGTHSVRVNATATAPVEKGAAFFLTASDPRNESTLLYAETARLVRNALNTRGLYEAPRFDKADLIVEIDYSMTVPRAQERTNAEGDSAGELASRRGPAPPSDSEIAKLRSTVRGPLAKTLLLTAREAKAKDEGPPRTLWSVELITIDTSNDFRKYLPLLAAVGIDHFGVDSGGSQTVTITETDKTVALLKNSK